MRPFEYVSPTNKDQVATLLGEHGSILAGGTDLLALMKDDVVAPERLVNIKQIDTLRGVSYQSGNGLRVGALTTVAEFAEDANVQRYYPVLADAANEVASPQIRNLATIGGNMCQRPRCWYFRNGMGLMAKTPDGKSMVVAGDNRYAAILGNSGPAYFVSPSRIRNRGTKIVGSILNSWKRQCFSFVRRVEKTWDTAIEVKALICNAQL